MQWPDFTTVHTLDELGKGIGAMLAQIRRRFRVETTGPLHQDGGELRIVPSATMTAQLTSHISGGKYNFVEVQAESGGTWSVVSGGRTGDDAFEANGDTGMAGKIVTLRFTENDDWRFAADHDCECECPILFCAHVVCTGTGDPIVGATVEIREANASVGTGTIIASGTTDGTGKFCSTAVPAGDVDIVVSKTDYHGVTSGPHTAACDSETTINLEMCPDSFSFTLNVTGCGCPLEGATVTITGDVSGGGTTDADGNVTIAIDVPSDDCTVSFTATITPPSGFATGEDSYVWSSCDGDLTGQNIDLQPVDTCLCAGGYAIPKTLSYTDSKGSCSIVWDATNQRWAGEYTYVEPDGAIASSCFGPPYPYDSPHNANVTVDVFLYYSLVEDACGTESFYLHREFRARLATLSCATGGPCLSLWVTAVDNSLPSQFNIRSYGGGVALIDDPSLDLTINYTYNTGLGTCSYNINHPAVSQAAGTATITGTCSGVVPVDPITITVMSNVGPSAISGATVTIKEGATTIASGITDVNGEVVFDEVDGLVDATEYEAHASSAPCTAPVTVPTFIYGTDPDFTITMNCPE